MLKSGTLSCAVFSVVFCSFVHVVLGNTTADTSVTELQTAETTLRSTADEFTTEATAPSSGRGTSPGTTFGTEWLTVNATDVADATPEVDTTIYLLSGVILMVLIFAVLVSAYTYKQYNDRQIRRKNALLLNVGEGEYYMDDGTANPDLWRDFGIQVDLDSDDEIEHRKSAAI